jgi:glyoxylase-like metal-dependent hydrolase (beta-lactamase superfamily II)
VESNLIKITENVFQIILSHLNIRETNAYLIQDEKLTLIDSGHPFQDSVNMLEEALGKLGYGFEDIDCIIYTHPHIDHAGGGLHISNNHNHIVHISHAKATEHLVDFNEDYHRFVGMTENFIDIKAKGAPPELIREVKDFFNQFYINDQNLGIKIDKTVDNGDSLKLGKTQLQVLHTPSHTSSDISLYEPEQKLLFTGDFILERGSSLLSYLTESDVDNYLTSLKKVEGLDVDVILTGHGNRVADTKRIIKRSFRYSDLIENNIMNLLAEDKKTIHEIVLCLLKGNLGEFIIWYRYLCMVDTYLNKLLREKKVFETTMNDNIYYHRNPKVG